MLVYKIHMIPIAMVEFTNSSKSEKQVVRYKQCINTMNSLEYLFQVLDENSMSKVVYGFPA